MCIWLLWNPAPLAVLLFEKNVYRVCVFFCEDESTMSDCVILFGVVCFVASGFFVFAALLNLLLFMCERFPDECCTIVASSCLYVVLMFVWHCARECYCFLSFHFYGNDDDDNCAICLVSVIRHPAQTLKCGHSFHCACIGNWLKQKNTCPCCRALAK